MIYIMSDIHGGWNEYRDILEQIQFSDSDHLYMLGDAIDRGPDGIEGAIFPNLPHQQVHGAAPAQKRQGAL